MIIDASPLISLERDPRRFLLLIDEALKAGIDLYSNHGVLAQVIRRPAQQAVLFQLLARDCVTVLPIDNATAIGVALESTKTSDVIDASVAVLARALNRPVLTSDTDDMSKFGVAVEPF